MLILLVQAYVGWRLLPDSGVGPAATVAGAVLLAVLGALVPLGFVARRVTPREKADRLAWAGMLALGLVSTLLVLTVLRDVALAALAVAHAFGASSAAVAAFARASALAVPAAAVVVSAVGFLNARRPARVRDVEVPIDGLPAALHGFTIAQISDVHVGPTIKRRYVERIVERVNALAADLVAITGDLVDGTVAELAPHTAPLARLTARHGTFFVTGNHDYYSGAGPWIRELRRLGLTVLVNEHVVLDHRGAPLVVAGVTDPSAHHFDPHHRSDPARAAAGAPAGAVRVLLAHQPVTAPHAARAGFHLQLSGHTHGGQFLPWTWFVRFWQPFTAGLHRLGDLWVYISRGTGYWGPPKRFGAPSEITRLTLVAAPRP